MKQETLNKPPRLFTTDQDKEEFVFWIETLKAGVLPQGRSALQSLDGYCCLGAGVVCTVAEENLIINAGSDELLEGTMPSKQPHAPMWLKNISYHCSKHYDYYISTENDLGTPHATIASMLWNFYKWELES